MKFYLIQYTLNNALRARWEGTQVLSAAKHKELLVNSPDASISEVDVPTDKPGLMAFLNEYVTGELSAEEQAKLLRQIREKSAVTQQAILNAAPVIPITENPFWQD